MPEKSNEVLAQEEIEKIYHEHMESRIKEVITYINLWYRGRCPNHIGSEFFRFISSSYGTLVRRVLNKDLQPKIVQYAESAFTDLYNIFIPANFFSQKFLRENMYILEENQLGKVALALFNHFNIHESLHIKLTKGTWSEWAECMDIKWGFPDEINWQNLDRNSVFVGVCNIVEDIFIEAYGRKNYPKLRKFLVLGRNNILFNPIYRAAAIATFMSKPTIDNYLGVMSLMKSEEFANDPPQIATDILGDKVFQLLFSAANPSLIITDRQEISYKIFMYLYELSQDENNQGEENQEGGEGEEGDGKGGKGNGNKQQSGDKNQQQNNDNPHFDDSIEDYDDKNESPRDVDNQMSRDDTQNGSSMPNATRQDREELENIVKQLTEAIENQSEKQNDRHDRAVFLNTPADEVRVEYQDIADTSSWYCDRYGYADIVPDRRFIQLGNLLRHARAIKSDYGIPRDKGRKLNKRNLWRIITDSKILTKKDIEKENKGEPEVIVLGDVSGSTCGSGGGDGYRDLLHSIVAGCYGAFESLKRAMIPTSVYVHSTSDYQTSNVYGIASFRMPMNGKDIITTSNHHTRFNKAMEVGHNMNADGNAIAHISERFTGRNCTKIIIVMSDGQPTVYPNFESESYLDMGEAWTRENVRYLRDKGIVVFSVSLTRRVVAANDRIYGQEFNIHGYRNLQVELQKLVMRLGLKY